MVDVVVCDSTVTLVVVAVDGFTAFFAGLVVPASSPRTCPLPRRRTASLKADAVFDSETLVEDALYDPMTFVHKTWASSLQQRDRLHLFCLLVLATIQRAHLIALLIQDTLVTAS
jgi:hypothetical protein